MSRLPTYILMEDPPVYISTIPKGFNMSEDWAPSEAKLRETLDAHPEPLFYISDTREFRLSLDDLIAIANIATRGQDPLWRHPKIRGVYIVSDLQLVEMAAKGLNNPIFGNTNIKVFDTVEKALEDIQRILAS
ncbi:MAG: hypothetical protein JXB07_18210 [Anaerolineae bacterium]|nr:hypothetical protein [Anaerolineae bacterium]